MNTYSNDGSIVVASTIDCHTSDDDEQFKQQWYMNNLSNNGI